MAKTCPQCGQKIDWTPRDRLVSMVSANIKNTQHRVTWCAEHHINTDDQQYKSARTRMDQYQAMLEWLKQHKD